MKTLRLLWLAVMMALVGCRVASAQERNATVQFSDALPLDRIYPLRTDSLRGWWEEVVQLSGRRPAIAFSSVEFWSIDQLPCPHGSSVGCRVHGLFIAPKDILLVTHDAQNECWVKHEIAHAVLGRGDEAHEDILFRRVRETCA